MEHTRLFERGACPPYETSYDAERSIVMTHDLADIAGFFAAFGVRPRIDLPDHIVSELEFMSLLCLKEAHALANGRRDEAEVCADAQRKFIAEHLGLWIAPFSKRLRESARLPVYRALAEVLNSFVALDAALLGIRLSEGQMGDEGGKEGA